MSTTPQAVSASNASQDAKGDAPPQGLSSSTSTTGAADKQGTFTLLLFASASTVANNTDSLTLEAPMTLKQLFEMLEEKFPGMKRKVLRSAAVTVNLEYVDFEVGEDGGVVELDDVQGDGKVWLRAGDEVAVVPPVSSG
ncbi:uncharacterized protein HMPREF1541_01021 [Cyphellophora europaea CBS 101466]|uniref:Molybdopterin synthase sulfur carrier subunit n=1 Tax=Cyphellophora europaea (strain CBS 101466) TaxID=1220924 RepID=W2SDR0_CYPE1|nr:uncharacterized protein HMPREF1541_01021 [Cyphellophora europaea CBS 101466]ETN46832.1 hypothetical protein HMPREF1541_01021 [Cyphellophora europaea CBS 101466]